MKKFFSFFAALLFAGSMMAEEATMTAGTNGSACTVNDVAGIKCGTSKAGGDMTITVGAGATKLSFYAAAWKGVTGLSLNLAADGVTFSPASVSLTADDGISNNTPFTLSGLPENFKFEVELTGVTAETMIAVTSSAAKRFVVWGASYEAGEAPSVATPVISGEAEFTESTQVSISCTTEGAAIYYTLDGADPTTNSLPYGEPFTLTETATVKAVAYDSENSQYSAIASKTFTKKEPLVAISCAEVYQKAKGTELALNNVVVAYANAKNVYVQDETGSMLLYLTQNTTWEAGNILSGVEGTLDIYNDLYEVKMTEAQVTAVQPGQGEVPAPVEFTTAPVAADMNKYILLKNVKVDTTAFPTTKNMNATIGGETFVLRNNFNADVAFDTTKLYDITGVVSVYKGAVQVYFINATEATVAPVHTYTVAGAPAALFINEWDPTDENNDMDPVLGGDLYVWRKDSVNLTAGDIEFKVCEDHAWTVAYPAQNYILNIAEAGYYDILIRFNPKAEPDAMINAGATKVGEAPQPADVWAEIKFTEAAAEDDIAEDAVYTAQDSEFALTLHDAGNKMAIDGNDCRFGTAESYTMYNFRIKSGGASSSDKNYFTLNIPEAGTLRLAPRTASNGATDRALIVIQGGDTLYNQIVQESQAIEVQEGENTVKVYPYVDVTVAAGEVVVRYTAGMNFYAFAFKANEPEPEVIWTVAGSKSVFGSEWSASDANNDMVKQEDGTYKWEKENITLAAGNVEFKVVKDHSWAEGYPASNYKLAITEDGVYSISITFNAETKEITADATKTGEAEIDPVVSIAGAMNGWNASADVMTLAEDKLTASLALNLDATTYEFKVVLNGGDWRSNGQDFTRENASATDMTGNEANMHLVADVAGEYVFTWTFADNSLVITYPEAPAQDIEITLSSLTTPGALIWTDAVAEAGWWQIMGANEAYDFSISNVSTTETAGVYTVDDLDADFSYINIYGENDTTKVAFLDGSVTVAVSEEGIVTINGTLVGSDGNNYIFNLTYKDPVAEKTVNVEVPEWQLVDDYVAYLSLFAVAGEDANGTYVQLALNMPDGATAIAGDYTEEDFDLQYFGCYVADANDSYRIFSATIKVAQNEDGKVFVTADLLCYNNTLYKVTTHIGEGINAVEAAQKAVKMIQNGQVEIIKNGVHYNINGAVIR